MVMNVSLVGPTGNDSVTHNNDLMGMFSHVLKNVERPPLVSIFCPQMLSHKHMKWYDFDHFMTIAQSV